MEETQQDTGLFNSPLMKRWGEDPIQEFGHSQQADWWWAHPLHKKVRSATSPEEWESYLTQNPKWNEELRNKNDKDPSEALIVLRALQYRINGGSEVHTKSFTQALLDGVLPEQPLDLWKEGWMRAKFAEQLVQSPPGSAIYELAGVAIDKWPWLFAWSAQSAQDYRHPVVRAVRAGNTELAEQLLLKLPAQEWMNVPGGKEDYYSFRGLWRDRKFWFQQDPAWVEKLVSIAPVFGEPHPATGLGPLEQAARDNLPELLRALLKNGWRPNPEKSFGLTLSHWAINGLSEEKWNSRSGKSEPKTPEEIEDSAQRCGQTLAVLAEFGFGLHDPVIKVEKVAGQRRPRLPKPKATATTMLEEMCAKERLKPSTLAILQQSNMLAATPPPASVPRATRSRL